MAGTNEMLKDMLPYGGAVNIHGEITWRVTEDEFNEMKRNLESIFDECHLGSDRLSNLLLLF
jgi:hypothetical protein